MTSPISEITHAISGKILKARWLGALANTIVFYAMIQYEAWLKDLTDRKMEAEALNMSGIDADQYVSEHLNNAPRDVALNLMCIYEWMWQFACEHKLFEQYDERTMQNRPIFGAIRPAEEILAPRPLAEPTLAAFLKDTKTQAKALARSQVTRFGQRPSYQDALKELAVANYNAAKQRHTVELARNEYRYTNIVPELVTMAAGIRGSDNFAELPAAIRLSLSVKMMDKLKQLYEKADTDGTAQLDSQGNITYWKPESRVDEDNAVIAEVLANEKEWCEWLEASAHEAREEMEVGVARNQFELQQVG